MKKEAKYLAGIFIQHQNEDFFSWPIEGIKKSIDHLIGIIDILNRECNFFIFCIFIECEDQNNLSINENTYVKIYGLKDKIMFLPKECIIKRRYVNRREAFLMNDGEELYYVLF